MDDNARQKDETTRGLISRRELLRRTAFLIGGATVGAPLLQACSPSPTPSPTAAPGGSQPNPAGGAPRRDGCARRWAAEAGRHLHRSARPRSPTGCGGPSPV